MSSFSEMNRRTLAFRGGGLLPPGAVQGGEAAAAWPPPHLFPPFPQLNGRAGPDEEARAEDSPPSPPPPPPPPSLLPPLPRSPPPPAAAAAEISASATATIPAAATPEEPAARLLLALPPQPPPPPPPPPDAAGSGSTSLGPGGGASGAPQLPERNRRTLAFRGCGGRALNLNLNGRGSELELRLADGLSPPSQSQSDRSTADGEDNDDGDGDGEGEEDGSGPEGEGGGDGEIAPIPHLPLLARPKSLLLKLQCSFEPAWLRDFPWLRYSRDTGLMFCGWCQPGPSPDEGPGGSGEEGGGVGGGGAPPSGSDHHPAASGGHDELSRGTRNYKKTLLLRHLGSAEHRLHEAHAQGKEACFTWQYSGDTPGSALHSGYHFCSAQESEIPSEEGYCDFNSRPNENSYCYQLLRQLNEQRKKGILCDVSIVVSGKVFKAHKNILVAGSRFFKTLYCFSNKESPNQNNTTHLDIAAVQGFSVILDFLYSGNLVLTSQNAIEVMTVASYLQMSEVVQTCRNFIKDALNISIKSEAPESVVVDYNNRKPVNRDGLPSSRDQKIATFWATRNLTNLASNIKIENDGCNIDEGQIDNYQVNDSNWVQDGSSELAENESESQTKVFVWNNMGSQETGKTRRKNQTTKRFVYNIPPNSETTLEDCIMMQPPIAYPEEDLSFIKEEPDLDGALFSGPDCERNVNTNLLAEASSGQDGGDAGTSHDFKFNLMPGPSSDFKFGLLGGTSSDFKFGLMAGASNDFKYGLLPESWPKQETWENGESSLIMNKLKCPHCSYVAKYRRTLKRHLLIHTGVRSFSCDICGKLFTRREHVKRHSLVHKKDKKYKCMVCKKIFMLAASVGIRHGSRRYGVCVDCADKSQPGGQEGVDQGQDTDFPRDEEYEENEVGEADEELVDDGEEQNDPSRWDESGDVCMSLDD